MSCITVVPLSVPDALTVAASDAVRHAERLFLQTDRHPAARWVVDAGIPYTSMDDLYDSAADFSALNEQIARRLTDSGACVYAVTGAVLDTQLPIIHRFAGQAGICVRVLPGIPAVLAAFPERRIDVLCTVSALPHRIDPQQSIAVDEITDGILAGEVKLLLGEYYPDDWPILLACTDAKGCYTHTEIPLYALDRQKRYDATTAAYVPAAAFEDLQRFSYDDLCDVLRRLRAPNGCPWDREQTHQSLREPLMEECYELIDAIDSGDDNAICEEAGDVLMHAAFHGVIASEQGRFTERDVSTCIVQKLVYRHPHVFGNVRVHSSDEVLKNWDALKMAEKSQKTHAEVLKSVPRCFPALTRASKVQHKAAKVGFDWPDVTGAIPKLAEETDELLRAMQGDGDVAEEMGDLLFSAVNVARLLKTDPEFLLREATDKFIDRFTAMEKLAVERGTQLENLSLFEMDALWDEAKNTQKL